MMGGILSDSWDILFGKPQSWYTHLDLDQKAFAVRAAEVNAIGEGPWNAVREAFFASSEGPGLEFLSFSDINNGITENLKSLIVTKDHVPTDADIAAAEAFNAQYGRYVDYVKSMVPEAAAQVKADSDAVRTALGTGTMKSPASVGQQAFIDEAARRASLLGAGIGLGALAYILVPAVVLFFLSGRGGK